MAKSSKEQISKGLLFTLIVSLLTGILLDIRATVKDTRAFQIDDTKRITKLEANVDNLKSDFIDFKENVTDRVGKLDDAVFHIQ